MANALYYDSMTNFNVTNGVIDTAATAGSVNAIFAGAKSDIMITSNGTLTVDSGGTFYKYAVMEDQTTDIPITSDGRVIDISRIDKWFYGAGYGRSS